MHVSPVSNTCTDIINDRTYYIFVNYSMSASCLLYTSIAQRCQPAFLFHMPVLPLKPAHGGGSEIPVGAVPTGIIIDQFFLRFNQYARIPILQLNSWEPPWSVSYTHLDVYKRQALNWRPVLLDRALT